MTLAGRNRNPGMAGGSPTDQGVHSGRFDSSVALRPACAPLWLCSCGARNRLRDTTCRNCGAGKP